MCFYISYLTKLVLKFFLMSVLRKKNISLLCYYNVSASKSHDQFHLILEAEVYYIHTIICNIVFQFQM